MLLCGVLSEDQNSIDVRFSVNACPEKERIIRAAALHADRAAERRLVPVMDGEPL